MLFAPTSGVGARNPFFRYRGYYYAAETGFYYLQSRYYDPEVSRFINADVVIGNESILGTNLFAYCFNNPANCFDDTGYWPRYYVRNTSKINCYAYVLGLPDFYEVPNLPRYSSVYALARRVQQDLWARWKRRSILLGTNYYSTNFDTRYYYLIAMRVGSILSSGSYDYHFMVRHETMTWSHKPGAAAPSMYIGSARYNNPSTIAWHRYAWYYPYPVTNPYYYNSATYYMAIEKW